MSRAGERERASKNTRARTNPSAKARTHAPSRSRARLHDCTPHQKHWHARHSTRPHVHPHAHVRATNVARRASAAFGAPVREFRCRATRCFDGQSQPQSSARRCWRPCPQPRVNRRRGNRHSLELKVYEPFRPLRLRVSSASSSWDSSGPGPLAPMCGIMCPSPGWTPAHGGAVTAPAPAAPLSRGAAAAGDPHRRC